MSIQDHHQRSASDSLSSHISLDMPSLELPMSSNENPPQLALSDIMHHMSPSPVPAEDLRNSEDLEIRNPYSNGNRRERSPEPLTEADVVAMRRRLHALGFSLDRDQNDSSIGEDITRHSDDFGNATLRERELVNMVLSLIDPLPIDLTQLERQANVISVLTSQRDFLVRQAEEDRDRWRSEREGWDRMAEALLSRRTGTGKSAAREDETERQKAQLESENRALRDKLQGTQNRLSSLESELMKLKPLLLMQPYSVAHLRQNLVSQPQASSQPPTTALTTIHGPPDVRHNKPTPDVKGKRREAASIASRNQLEPIPEDQANEEPGLGPSSQAHPGSSTPSSKVPLSSGASNSTTDIYRQPESLPQYSYPYNYHYSIPSTSSPKSTFIPPKIAVNSPSSSSTDHSQLRHHTTAGSTSKSTVLQFHPITPSQSQRLPQESPTVSPQRQSSRDNTNNPAGASHNAPIRRSNHRIAPLTSDARTEHVLLAARRIGRERAALVAGIMQHAEQEKEIHAQELELMKARQDLERSEKARLERLANGTSGLAYYRSTDALTSPQQRNTGRGSAPVGVPRTPKRGGGIGATHYPSLGGTLGNSPISSPTRVPTSSQPSTFVFVNTSAAESPGYSGGGIMGTPSQLGSVLKSGSTARGDPRNLPSNPPTPLDSLLDAARSMMDDGAGGKAGGKTNGTREASEHPESPVPKRRRVSSGGSKSRGGGLVGAGGGGKVARVRSALDVLADQAAAVFDEPGQTRRESNAGGKRKEKRKFVEGLGSDGDRGLDSIQEDDDVDQQNDSWPQGSTSASASASAMGPSRGRSRAKAAGISTRSIAEPTSTSSMSLRPVRQASQKRLASQDLQSPPSISTTNARGKGKSRGRPKGSKSRPRSDISGKSSSTSKMNPSTGPRVIAIASTYSPFDEVMALQPQRDKSQEKEKEQERSQEHFQWTPVNLDRSSGMGSPRLGLRPVVEWGNRGAEEDEGDEDVEGEDEDVTLIVTGGHELELGQQNGHGEGKLESGGATAVEVGNDQVTAISTHKDAESMLTVETTVQATEENTDKQIGTSSNDLTISHASPTDLDLVANPHVDGADADAEAGFDDEDAEGEQEEEEEEEENADAEAGQDWSSRSRTPPPPDPPFSGAPSDSNDDDPDADADAEGEMEFEENDELPPTSTSSTVHRTALSVPVGQVPPNNFYGSFSEDDIWLIKISWMRLYGCKTTCTHVLISAMVPESFSPSLSILSDLSEKMSLQLGVPEREGSIVRSREGWWRNIDVKGQSENLSLVF